MNGWTLPGNTMDEWANWQSLMTSAARLQREVPGTVLVGGTAAALLVEHRFSYDADHVVADLKDRYNHVLHHLESLDGWTTARRTSSPPFTILGSLDGQLAGVRQLRRTVPLETQEIQYGSQTLCIPTYEEILRVKGYMVLARNYNRDYVDFLALAGPLPDGVFNEALVPFEMFYETLSQSVGGSGEGGTVAIGVGCGAERAQWGPGDRICVVSPTHSPPDPRMATIIQLRDQPFTDACPAPDRCGGCGAAAWHGHGRVPRTVTDLHGDRVVSVRRYRCQACGHTVTVAPAGVDAKGRTRRLRAHLVLLYCLGLSHRGVEAALAPLGVHVDHVTVWRDLQELAVRMQARGPVGKVRVAMPGETRIPIGGGKRPVAVVTDAADGTILQLEVSDGDFDWQA